jgi:hypothetical protein
MRRIKLKGFHVFRTDDRDEMGTSGRQITVRPYIRVSHAVDSDGDELDACLDLGDVLVHIEGPRAVIERMFREVEYVEACVVG